VLNDSDQCCRTWDGTARWRDYLAISSGSAEVTCASTWLIVNPHLLVNGAFVLYGLSGSYCSGFISWVDL
jgi:hypothetical protein